MVTRDLYSNQKVSQLLDPAVVTADVNSTGIDLAEFDSVMLAVLVGESGDTLSGSVLFELELQESDSLGSGYTAVADADITNPVTGGSNVGRFALIDDPAEDDAVYIVGYRGTKQFVRVVINATGTHTNGTPIGVVALQGHPHRSPVNATS